MCLHPASELARRVKSVFFTSCASTSTSKSVIQHIVLEITPLFVSTHQAAVGSTLWDCLYFFFCLFPNMWKVQSNPLGKQVKWIVSARGCKHRVNDLFSEHIVLDEHTMLSYSSPTLPHVGCLMLWCNYQLQEASKQQTAWPSVRSSYICLLQIWHNRVSPKYELNLSAVLQYILIYLC